MCALYCNRLYNNNNNNNNDNNNNNNNHFNKMFNPKSTTNNVKTYT